MTAIVGILCRDGVVVGTDSSSTFVQGNQRTIEQKTKKLHIIEQRVIVAGTGYVGHGQRFCGIVQDAHDKKVFTKPHLEVGTTLCETSLRHFQATGGMQGQFGALVAYASGGKFHLCEFPTVNFQPEWKTEALWFVSLGSGQSITDPFLGLMRRVFWKDKMPSVADAIFVATWALQHAIDVNPGGINGPAQIGVIRKGTKGDVETVQLDESALLEHVNNVEGAERYLAQYTANFQGTGQATIPTVEALPAETGGATKIEMMPVNAAAKTVKP